MQRSRKMQARQGKTPITKNGKFLHLASEFLASYRTIPTTEYEVARGRYP